MLDVKLFRNELETIRADLMKRGWSEAEIEMIDKIVQYDKEWRNVRSKADDLKQYRNAETKKIAELRKAGEDASEKINKIRGVSEEIKVFDQKIRESLKMRDFYRMRIPNIMDESVPVGKDSTENVPIRSFGTPQTYDFSLKSHQEVIEGLGMGDFDQSRKSSGAGFYYLFNDMVLLDMALQWFGVTFLMENGFKVVEPPYMLNRKAMEGAVNLSDFDDVLYKIEGEDLYLIATSEHPLSSLMMGKTVPEKDLPLRFCGVSPCFRREIGAHGIDTKGIFRTHQFNKIEQFIFSTPEQSPAEHELMIHMSQQLFEQLELPYRIVNICTGDLGGTASKKYDLEVWMARQGEYKEAVSCSNCTSYQARKLGIKVERPDGRREVLHTLNSTAIATSRAMVAILENNQQADGTVIIPKVLRKYIGKDIIGG